MDFSCYLVSPLVQPVSTNSDDKDSSDSATLRFKRQSQYRAIRAEYNSNLYQGDIVIEKDPTNVQHEAAIRDMTWPDAIVPYTIDIFDSRGKALIEDAMNEFMDKTCVKFRPKTADDDYFIKIVAKDGCASTVGRSRFAFNGQEVFLSDGCYNPGTIRHELMHTLGFYHEQSRTDRDNYIRIIWENIESGLEDQFEKNNYREVSNLGSSYDYGSLMHYPFNAFSRDESVPTITKIDGSTVGFGQRRGFSDTDLYEINKLYNCPDVQGGSGKRWRPDEFGGGFETTESTWGRRTSSNRMGGSSFRRNNERFGGFGETDGEEVETTTEEASGETKESGDDWFDRWVTAAKEKAKTFFGEHFG
uniref:Metalloendopeptidase n=1 Tax=Plectus sambesii TaxID=2011161 RepID=A0A914VKP1_9BILA